MQLSTFALAGLLGLVSAQSTRVTVVQVGVNGNLSYSPNNIRVNQGEMVQFQFMGGNHTATTSTFDQPCQPASMFNPNVTGFHSGFIPAAASAAMGQIATYTIMVNDTKPIWVYCSQGKHCEMGMVMVINENPNAPDKSLTKYRELAAQAQTVVPNGGQETGGGQTGQTPAGAAGSSLSVPSTLSLLAFVVGAFLL